MKISWGTGIVIAFVLFMTFILYFVFKVQSDSKYDHEMVTEDYYKKELSFQDQLNKTQNSNDLEEKLTFEMKDEGLQIKFPSSFDFKKITGKVSFYRPSNQKLDFEKTISLSDSYLLIPKTDLVDGRWDLSVDWEYEGNGYFDKLSLNL